jgi:SIR2-like domain
MAGTVVLLGAGASVEADVPASMTMTQTIVDHIDSQRGRYEGVAQALNFAVGALVAHDTATGASPYAGIDVERLFSAIQMLGNRSAVEVAPFIATWSPILDSIGPEGRFPAFFDKMLKEAITSERSYGNNAERLIKEAINSLTEKKDSQAIFRILEASMTQALRTLVAIDPAKVDYLAPLLQVSPSPVRIATLNYDKSIEELANRAGMVCDTGIGAWPGGHDWAWESSADIHLLKLHGSIDWVLKPEVGLGGLTEWRIAVVSDPADVTRGYSQDSPALVFGARGKLRAEGPFLAMLRAFDTFLTSADRLLVVGYSFRDEHINTALRRWINARQDRQLVVIDVNFNPNGMRDRRNPTFAQELTQAMTVRDGLTMIRREGFRVLNTSAGEGLREVLGEGPSLAAAAPRLDLK